jgi:hypothetical protein
MTYRSGYREALEAAQRIIDLHEKPKARPTIAELEAILASDDGPPVNINPDGSISAGPSDALTVARALLSLKAEGLAEGQDEVEVPSGRDAPSDEHSTAREWRRIGCVANSLGRYALQVDWGRSVKSTTKFIEGQTLLAENSIAELLMLLNAAAGGSCPAQEGDCRGTPEPKEGAIKD